MVILSIPAEVADANLLPYLEWNDLLRLRRVCKWTKGITDGYLKAHPELAPEIQINEEGDKSFEAFLKMGIPTTKIFLNNISGREFYEKCGEDMSSFLEQFGLHIKYLRVDQISLFLFGKEFDFLNALKNLESFEAKSFGGYRRGLTHAEAVKAIAIQKQRYREESTDKDEKDEMVVFPEEILKKLKVLKIGNNDEKGLGNPIENIHKFLALGKSLQSVAIPFNPLAQPAGPYFTESNHKLGELTLTFSVLQFHMEWNEEKADLANCKELDFASFHDYVDESLRCQVEVEYLGSPSFLLLCKRCFKAGIKLFNVAPSWFQAKNCSKKMVRRCSLDIGTTIISLVNIDPRVFSFNLPNLEKIVITGTSKSSPGEDWQQNRPDWPALKTLEITVDSKECSYSKWRENVNRPVSINMKTTELYNFLFQDVSRLALTELKLEFKEGLVALPCPKIELIVDSCPNLKKLSLVNWLGSNKELVNFWIGLPSLEEVALERCKSVGNAAFIGNDVPVFLTLKKLKKLTLKGLDRMPKITDTLFSLVIRHLELTHLFLSSDAPLKSVTLAGIRSLCDGRFAKSIEKFPFQDWRLSNISEDKFKQHEAMFRSYNML